MNGITWNRIVGAAERRLVSMPGELAGYLSLGALDAMGDRPGRVVAEDIRLTEAGRVILLRVLPCDPRASDRCLRGLLRQILEVSTSPSPALLRVASVSETAIEAAFATELQTALVPVNRAAARRALSRLHRELSRLPEAVLATLESPARAALRDSEVVRAWTDDADLPRAEQDDAGAVLRDGSLDDGFERPMPIVASIDEGLCVSDALEMVSPRAAMAEAHRTEIPDLDLPANPRGPSLKASRAGTASSSGIGEAESICAGTGEVESIEHCGQTPMLAAVDTDEHAEVRAQTLVLAPVVTVESPSGDELGAVAQGPQESDDRSLSRLGVRETTLVIAQVAPAPSLEHTLQLRVAPTVASASTLADADAGASQQPVVLEPTMALPLVTLKRRGRAAAVAVEGACQDRGARVPAASAVEPSCLGELAVVESGVERESVDSAGNEPQAGVESGVEDWGIAVDEDAVSVDLNDLLDELHDLHGTEPRLPEMDECPKALTPHPLIVLSANDCETAEHVETPCSPVPAVAKLNEVESGSREGATDSVELATAASTADELPADELRDDDALGEFTDVELNAVVSSWEATSVEAVVEVSDDEIMYEQVEDESLWVDVDCSDEGLFEAVVPRVVAFDRVASTAGSVVRTSEEDPVASTEHALAIVDELSLGEVAADSCHELCDDAALDVDDAELLVVKDQCDIDAQCPLESSRTSMTCARLEPSTQYRDEERGSDGPRSTIDGLSNQFASEPVWSPSELCRNLRFVAGLDLSPTASSVQTHTPPPTVETVLAQNPEHSEPTRRLRRAGSMVAVVLSMGVGAYGIRSAEGNVAFASRLPVDPLGQICRATITVEGVDASQHLRIRQVGDVQFRSPSAIFEATARFAGLRCGQDAELLVQDIPLEGLRRIPISGDRLLPRDVHPWASVRFRLDETGSGG